MATTKRRTRKTSSTRPATEAALDAIEAGAATVVVESSAPLDHVARANRYIEDVLSGKVPACKYVKAACARQKRDLERYAADRVFYFDANLAGRACRFLELLPHIKGPAAFVRADGTPNTIAMEDWQCFIVTTVFGWRRRDTGGRRYRRAYIEVPRGNAKSTLSSGIGLYGLTSDNEEGPEVYSAATTRDQAKIVFGDAQKMLRKKMAFTRGTLKTLVNNHEIVCQKNNGIFIPLSREAKSLDGKNVHVAVIDELHAHPTREVYDVIETACSKRYASLMWIITTAGSDTAGICYEVRTYCVKLLDGIFEDDSQFAIIYTIDDGDDWMDPAVWRKANPNWGVSVMPDNFASLAQKAMQLPSAQANFKTKHLNVWVNAAMAWMDMRAWDRAGDPNLMKEDFEKQAAVDKEMTPIMAFDGLDLASKIDIVARASVFKKMLRASRCKCGIASADHPPLDTNNFRDHEFPLEPHYYAFVQCYLPEAALNDGRNSQYKGWELEGRIITTPGEVIEYARVEEDIVGDRDRFHLLEVGFDPWQAAPLAQNLEARGFDGHTDYGSGPKLVEVQATTKNFSAPMKEIDALIRNGHFHHDANPVLRWMASNVVCHVDAKENIYPRKERPENKIDGIVALIIAMSRALVNADDSSPYSESRGFRTL